MTGLEIFLLVLVAILGAAVGFGLWMLLQISKAFWH